MYCPDCGTENTSAQRFCRQCGSNLTSVKLAREVINAPADVTSQVEPSAVFRAVTLISILGFLFVTGGAIALTGIQAASRFDGPPFGVFLALFGYGSLFMIDRQLLKLLGPGSRRQRKSVDVTARPAVQIPADASRSIAEGTPYGSVTEPTTRQFQEERRSGR